MSRALGFGLFALAWGACGGRSSSGASADAGNSDCRLPPDTASLPTDDAAAGAPPLVSDASRAGAAGDPVDAGGNAGASDGGEAPLVDAGAAGAEGEPRSDGAGGGCGRAAGARFATSVVDHAFGGGQNFNQEQGFPGALLGPPVAGDPTSVVSLGNGGWLILEFAGNAVVDGPGVDFTVFENPLADFRELGTVAVSDDLRTWVEFPCTASQDAHDFGYCAGVAVVLSSPTNGVDPLDPKVSGGDQYDLSDIHVAHARYVRITDRVDLTGQAGVFDLDAVAIVHGECP